MFFVEDPKRVKIFTRKEDVHKTDQMDLPLLNMTSTHQDIRGVEKKLG